MQSLDTLMAACRQALEGARQHDHWQAAYCEAVGPATVLELIAQLTAAEACEPADDHTALLKLVRDMAGYIKLATRDKADPVRDDLLLQARELVARLER